MFVHTAGQREFAAWITSVTGFLCLLLVTDISLCTAVLIRRWQRHAEETWHGFWSVFWRAACGKSEQQSVPKDAEAEMGEQRKSVADGVGDGAADSKEGGSEEGRDEGQAAHQDEHNDQGSKV